MLVTWNVACWEGPLYWTIKVNGLGDMSGFIGVPYTIVDWNCSKVVDGPYIL